MVRLVVRSQVIMTDARVQSPALVAGSQVGT